MSRCQTIRGGPSGEDPVSKAAGEDKRLGRRSMAQRLRAVRDARPSPDSMPDLVERVQPPPAEEVERLAKEFELERTARAERIRRGMERSAQPVVLRPVVPIDLEDKDL
jgi:hypothetical protein